MVSAASAPLISEHVADAAALAHVHLREGQVETCVLTAAKGAHKHGNPSTLLQAPRLRTASSVVIYCPDT